VEGERVKERKDKQEEEREIEKEREKEGGGDSREEVFVPWRRKVKMATEATEWSGIRVLTKTDKIDVTNGQK
jgi:hypothetical protein